jgi:hypothetical protein
MWKTQVMPTLKTEDKTWQSHVRDQLQLSKIRIKVLFLECLSTFMYCMLNKKAKWARWAIIKKWLGRLRLKVKPIKVKREINIQQHRANWHLETTNKYKLCQKSKDKDQKLKFLTMLLPANLLIGWVRWAIHFQALLSKIKEEWT